MKILSVRHIDGPNVYIYKPVMVARVDLQHLSERESYEFPGFVDHLLRSFPGLREHHCAKGEPGGFVERLYGGTYFGHIVEHLAIELACCVGIDVHYGKTLYAGGTGQYDIVVECKAYPVQKYLLEAATDIVGCLLSGTAPLVSDVLDTASRLLAKTQLGPSTQAIVDVATQRQIPVRRVSDGSLIQLGYGRHRKWVEATITENTSAVAVDIACDKELTKRVLQDAGIPVPAGGVAHSAEEAVEQLEAIGAPVVVKPYNGNQGRGVSLNLCIPEDVREAYQIAARISEKVIVEQYVQGRNIRLLVVAGQFVAASERLPARVCGDGRRSIRQLIEEVNCNPLRGDGHEKPLTKIVVDPVVEATLRRQHFTLDHIPPAGMVVMLRNNANLSTGGEAIDVTDEIHPTYQRLAQRTAAVVGLDVCGIDMVIANPVLPYHPGQSTVIEVNAAPGIRMHEHPSHGLPRRAAEAIVRSLFPQGNGRIPIVSITGTNGKTTTTRLIGHVLQSTGKTVGMTTTGGIWVATQQVADGDTTGPASARMVLSDPSVDVAVLETARGGIVRGGLAYDKANVAVLTNITVDHLGQDSVDTLEDLLHIKSLVAECVWEDGVVVLNAADPHLVDLGRKVKARVAYFALAQDHPVLARHLACGGVGYYVADGWFVEARGNLTWQIAAVAEVPLTGLGTVRFQVENCLAAIAALRALGCTRQQVAEGLTSFVPSVHNPGRCSVYRMQNGSYVVLDYGHNPDGFKKVGSWIRNVPHRRLIGVVGVPGDRSDVVIRQGADVLADVFDVLVVKEDRDKRGRQPGEVAGLMADQIRTRNPEKMCTAIFDEVEALRFAVQQALPGDVVVMFYEKLAPAQNLLADTGGVPVTHIVAPVVPSTAIQ